MYPKLREHCEKILSSGLIIELLQLKLKEINEKYLLVFHILISEQEEAINELKLMFAKKEMDPEESVKDLVEGIWEVIDNIEEKCMRQLEIEIAALKYSLILNPVFNNIYTKEMKTMIEKKYLSILKNSMN